MSVIYEPKGAAREYSPLACNLYSGCEHGCKYCYVPGIPPWKYQDDARLKFHKSSLPRKNILRQIENDAKKMHGDKREILLCFTCDPYQVGRDNSITTGALEIMAKHKMNAQVLTKGGMEAVEDFRIMKANKWKFGTTLLFSDDESRVQWEPCAATVESRIDAIRQAHEMGIYTWVSIEPVIDPAQALEVIRTTKPFVDYYKVGKLNHDSKKEATVDWSKFYMDVADILFETPHLIKDALLAYAPKENNDR